MRCPPAHPCALYGEPAPGGRAIEAYFRQYFREPGCPEGSQGLGPPRAGDSRHLTATPLPQGWGTDYTTTP